MNKLFAGLDLDTRETYLFCLLLKMREQPQFRCKADILSAEQGHRCAYCGTPFLEPPPYQTPKARRRWFATYRRNLRVRTIEHVIRRVDGGETIWDNEVVACLGCNTRRGEIDAYLYFEHYEQFAALRKRVKKITRAASRKRHRDRQLAELGAR